MTIEMSLKQLNKSFSPYIGEIIDFSPIGHHELGRNLVYKIITKTSPYTLKIYLQNNKWPREVYALKRFEALGMKMPYVISYGCLEGQEWLIYEYKKGMTMDIIPRPLRQEEAISIYRDLGTTLGRVHTATSFDYFGDIDLEGKPLKAFKTYMAYYENYIQELYHKLLQGPGEDAALLVDAYAYLRTLLPSLKKVTKPHLCHNDFNLRNVIAKEVNGAFTFNCLIDFEQTLPGDKDKELVHFYLPLKSSAPALARAFKQGYETVLKIDEKALLEKSEIYNLERGLNICSWAKKNAPDYYAYGLELIRQNFKADPK